MGRLSPLDGTVPERSDPSHATAFADGGQGSHRRDQFTNEGEATAHYISEMLKGRDCALLGSRVRPVGGELEYVDTGLLRRLSSNGRLL